MKVIVIIISLYVLSAFCINNIQNIEYQAINIKQSSTTQINNNKKLSDSDKRFKKILEKKEKYAINKIAEIKEYLKVETLEDAERNRILGKVDLLYEFLGIVEELKPFYYEEKPEYKTYKKNENGFFIDENLREEASRINNEISKVSRSFKKMAALSKFIEIGTRERRQKMGETDNILNNHSNTIEEKINTLDESIEGANNAIYE